MKNKAIPTILIITALALIAYSFTPDSAQTAQAIQRSDAQQVATVAGQRAQIVRVAKKTIVLDVTTSELLTLVNRERKAAGKAEVQELSHFSAGATTRARFLVQNNQWSHDGYAQAIYNTLWKPASASVGEDLAKNYNSDSETVSAWMNSPKHKDVMLGSAYKYAGIGHYQNYTVLWMSDQP